MDKTTPETHRLRPHPKAFDALMLICSLVIAVGGYFGEELSWLTAGI